MDWWGEVLFFMSGRAPGSTLFPYTTLFRARISLAKAGFVRPADKRSFTKRWVAPLNFHIVDQASAADPGSDKETGIAVV